MDPKRAKVTDLVRARNRVRAAFRRALGWIERAIAGGPAYCVLTFAMGARPGAHRAGLLSPAAAATVADMAVGHHGVAEDSSAEASALKLCADRRGLAQVGVAEVRAAQIGARSEASTTVRVAVLKALQDLPDRTSDVPSAGVCRPADDLRHRQGRSLR